MPTQHAPTITAASIAEAEHVDIQALALRVQRLSQGVDWWNTAMIWALIFAAFAAVAVVVTTRLALVRAKQLTDAQDQLIEAKDRQLQSDLKAKDVEIGNLGINVAAAVASAKEADARIAEAQRGAAEASAKGRRFSIRHS